MDIKQVLHKVGTIFIALSIVLLVPTLYSHLVDDGTAIAFLMTSASTLVIGFAFLLIKSSKKNVNALASLVIVAIAWIILSLIGTMPFVISGYIPNFFDALFESVSGFTTTGSTILNDIEALPASLLIWRSFSQWVGGLGILVFVLSIMPDSDSQSYHLIDAENASSKLTKIVSKAKHRARALCLTYIVLTIILFVILLLEGLEGFDCACLAFSTAGTGGFAPLNASIAGYNNIAVEITLMIFMFIFSINFVVFVLIVIGKFKNVIKNEEFIWFISIIIVAVVAVTLSNIGTYGNFWESLRKSSFQVISFASSTGFVTTDINMWPVFPIIVLVALMFMGGCAGSTAGGFKVYRVCIIFKHLNNHRKSITKSHAYSCVKYNGEVVEETMVQKIFNYLALYMAFFLGFAILISLFDNVDITTTFSASLSSLSNMGAGIGQIQGLSNYNCFSDASKLLITIEMIIGRLEILPIIAIFSKYTWKRTA